MATARPNQSMITGMACLSLIASAGEALGSREIARRLGLEHTKANRALGTLVLMGLAERTAERKYVPGSALHVLAAQALHGSRLLSASLPHLRALKDDGFTVALGVLWQEHVCYLVHARPVHTLEEGIGRHELWPARKSSLGIALLAAQDGRSRPGRTQAVKRARKQGYGLLTFPSGEISVAVTIDTPAVAALGVSSTAIADADIPSLVARLRDNSAAIAMALHTHATPV